MDPIKTLHLSEGELTDYLLIYLLNFNSGYVSTEDSIQVRDAIINCRHLAKGIIHYGHTNSNRDTSTDREDTTTPSCGSTSDNSKA